MNIGRSKELDTKLLEVQEIVTQVDINPTRSELTFKLTIPRNKKLIKGYPTKTTITESKPDSTLLSYINKSL